MEDLNSTAAGIAHDINNELTLILNHLSLRNVDAARVATKRCASLARNLLTLCRHSRLSPDNRAVDLTAFVSDFALNLRLPEDILLDLDLPAEPRLVLADPAYLTRILLNLVRNSCDAMSESETPESGTLSIRLSGDAASGGVVSVQDSGPGIHPSWSDCIFEPWFSTKGPGGSGLGLAIVRDLMQKQGGSIVLNARPGEGACFELRFQPCSGAI